MVRSNNYSVNRRPLGWRNESYRHSLSAKGIETKRFNGSLNKGSAGGQGNRYFARDELKGNRNNPSDPYASIRKSLNAQGYNSSEQTRLFGVPPKQKKSKTLFDVPDRDELGARLRQDTPINTGNTISPGAQLPDSQIETEGQFAEATQPIQPSSAEAIASEQFEQPTASDASEEFPEEQEEQEVPIEQKKVSELTESEKRKLMDQMETRGVPRPPPTFSTPGVSEMPPSSPFSQNDLVSTPAQRPFLSEGSGVNTVTRPMLARKDRKPTFGMGDLL